MLDYSVATDAICTSDKGNLPRGYKTFDLIIHIETNKYLEGMMIGFLLGRIDILIPCISAAS